MTRCCRKKACHITTAGIGLLLIIAGALLIGLDVADKIIDEELSKQLVLSLNSPAFSQWVNPAPPIYMQYWIFNVTNPENVTKGGKPIVKEIGPYTYRLYQPRTDIAFYANSTASYKYNHTLVFQKDMSPYDINLRLTQLNIPLLTVQSLTQTLPSWVPSRLISLLADALGDSSVFVQHTVEELLFGYDDPVFELVHKLLKLAKIDFPPQFGLFLGFNNSDDGVYLVDTGKNHINNTNIIRKWNGNQKLSWWTTPQANMINGTDGVFMPPKIDKSQNLSIFNTDLCRSVFLSFQSDTTVRGIDTVRFELPGIVFANKSVNPDNAGFCVPSDKCYDAGVLSISTCKQGAPVLVSSPHFYLGAEKYINGVQGMKPNKKYHETYLDIEPMSGAVFSAMKRMQINIDLKDEGLLPQMKHIKHTIFPVVWLNESVLLDTNTADMFKSQILTLLNFVHAMPYIVLGLGVFLLILGGGLLFYYSRKKESQENSALLNNKDGTDEDEAD